MPPSIASDELHRKIVIVAALAGLFFGLMPPYVLTIVVVATWGVPPLEPPDEQTFRAIYFLRLVLGNVLGLTVGAGLAAAAAHYGLRIAGQPTYPRGAVGGAVLGGLVGAVTAGSCPLLLLISSTNPQWAWIMVQRSVLVGGIMGATNGLAAGLVIVYLVRHYRSKDGEPSTSTGLTPGRVTGNSVPSRDRRAAWREPRASCNVKMHKQRRSVRILSLARRACLRPYSLAGASG